MAVNIEKTKVSLRLQLENGVDEKGNPKYQQKSFSNVRLEAEDEDLHIVGTLLGGLFKKDLDSIKKVEESIITKA